MLKSVTAPIPAHITEHPVLTTTKAKKNAKAKPVTPEETPMETVSNLKRRSSGEGAAKKMRSGPSDQGDPLEGSSNTFPQRQPQQTPLESSLPLTSLPPLNTDLHNMLPLYMLPLKNNVLIPHKLFNPRYPYNLYSLHNLHLRHHLCFITLPRFITLPTSNSTYDKSPSLKRLAPKTLFRTLSLPSARYLHRNCFLICPQKIRNQQQQIPQQNLHPGHPGGRPRRQTVTTKNQQKTNVEKQWLCVLSGWNQ